MNKLYLFLFLLVASSLLSSCDKENENASGFLAEKSGRQYVSENNEFGLNLFRKVNVLSSDNNKLISPFNISMAMGMTYNGAANRTADQIKSVLGWENLSSDEINRYNKELLSSLFANSENIQLNIANSIWYGDNIDIKSEFLRKNSSVFDAEIFKVDFSDNSTVRKMNDWVQSSTNRELNSIVDGISSRDMMCFINTTYFHGVWKHSFNTKNTSKAEFFVTNGDKRDVEMMYQKSDLNYYKGNSFQFVEMPYENENYVMYIMLPDEDSDIDEVISTLDYNKWNSYKSELEIKRNINFGLPKFKFQQQTSLIKLLSSMGIENLFVPEKSDLSNICDRKIFINQMMHNATIEVNEKGTKATAASSVASTFTALVDDNPFNLIVDRPFLFTIEEKSTNTILFIGEIVNP
ncbi:MAG: serpin family protein [Bacteroidota bacterium]|nr:serpin family protein [Bacteroidota bacterium]